MKFLGKLIVLLIAVLVVLVFVRNGVVKAIAENGVRAVTGLPLNINKLDINLAGTLVDIEGLVVKNPAGFHETALADIPKILVDYNLPDILKGEIHLENLEFDMRQFTVVRNEKGELNLNRLRALQGTQKAPVRATSQEPEASPKPMPVRIDAMHLRIGKVVYVDYAGGSPSSKEFLINLDQSFRDITDLNSVVRLIVLKAMMSSGISNLVNFDIRSLEGSLTGAFDTSTKLAAQFATKGLDTLKTAAGDPNAIAGQAGDMFKDASGAVGSTAKKMSGGVKDAAKSLKNKLKLPF